MDLYARVRLVIGTTAEWQANNLVLGDGEPAIERQGADVVLRIGDGVTPFLTCPSISGSGGGSPTIDWATVADVEAGTDGSKVVSPVTVYAAGVDVSSGVSDAGRLLKLDSNGQIDSSFIVGTISFKGSALDITGSAPASPKLGDIYVVSPGGVADASFTGLAGQTIVTNTVIIWDGSVWRRFYARVSATTGTADAHKLVETDDRGLIDASFLSDVVAIYDLDTDILSPAPSGILDGSIVRIGTGGVAGASWTGLTGTTILAGELLLWNGTEWQQISKPYVTVTTGLPDAYKYVATNAQGLIDSSFVPTLRADSMALKGTSLDVTTVAPTAPKTGDTYKVATGGVASASFSGLNGVTIYIGDLLTWNGSVWVRLVERNPATDSRQGLVELATDVEVKTATDTFRSITPKTLSDNYLKLSGGTLTGPLTLPAQTGVGGTAPTGLQAVSLDYLNQLTVGGTDFKGTLDPTLAPPGANSGDFYIAANGGTINGGFGVVGVASTLDTFWYDGTSWYWITADTNLAPYALRADVILRSPPQSIGNQTITTNAIGQIGLTINGTTGQSANLLVVNGTASFAGNVSGPDQTVSPPTANQFVTKSYFDSFQKEFLVVADTPPSPVDDNTLWVESDDPSFPVYVRYNDGSSTQWVRLNDQGNAGYVFLNPPAGSSQTIVAPTQNEAALTIAGVSGQVHPILVVGGEAQFLDNVTGPDQVANPPTEDEFVTRRFLGAGTSAINSIQNGSASLVVNGSSEIIATTDSTQRLKIDLAGAISTGNNVTPQLTAPGSVSVYTDLDASNDFMAFGNGNVSHPFTSLVQATTAGKIGRIGGNNGGLRLQGYRDGFGAAVQIEGFIEGGATAVAPILFSGIVSDGAGGTSSMNSLHAIAAFANNGSVVATFHAGGDLHLEGEILSYSKFNNYGVSTTLVAIAQDRVNRFTGSSPGTFTIQNSAFLTGAKINMLQAGTGTLSFALDAGTLRLRDGLSAVAAGQWSVVTAMKVDSTEWVLFGDLLSI